MEQIFLNEARAPEFKATWDLLVLGTNASVILLVFFLSELLVFLDTPVRVAEVFFYQGYVPLTLFIPVNPDICRICVRSI